jgi:hypothetical protein
MSSEAIPAPKTAVNIFQVVFMEKIALSTCKAGVSRDPKAGDLDSTSRTAL